jgi:hypothetical protein
MFLEDCEYPGLRLEGSRREAKPTYPACSQLKNIILDGTFGGSIIDSVSL